jgi:hypothetical protein
MTKLSPLSADGSSTPLDDNTQPAAIDSQPQVVSETHPKPFHTHLSSGERSPIARPALTTKGIARGKAIKVSADESQSSQAFTKERKEIDCAANNAEVSLQMPIPLPLALSVNATSDHNLESSANGVSALPSKLSTPLAFIGLSLAIDDSNGRSPSSDSHEIRGTPSLGFDLSPVVSSADEQPSQLAASSSDSEKAAPKIAAPKLSISASLQAQDADKPIAPPISTPARISGQSHMLPSKTGTPKKEESAFASVKVTPFTRLQGTGTDAARQQPTMSTAESEEIVDGKAHKSQPGSITSNGQGTRVAARPLTTDASFSARQTSLRGDTVEASFRAGADSLIAPFRPTIAFPEAPSVSKVTPIFNAITDTLARLQTDGHTSVEMQIRLPDGQQLAVRLQLNAGELQVTFRTDSSHWREAVSQAWPEFSNNAFDRGIKITNPVFEAPSAQAGFNHFDRQPHNHREPTESRDETYNTSKPSSQKGRLGPLPTAGAPATAPVGGSRKRAHGLTAWA